MMRCEIPKKSTQYGQKSREIRIYKKEKVEFYDRKDFDHFCDQEKFKVRKVKKRRFDKTPSPIKFDLNKDYTSLL
ncbi:unnamed protein product [Moneuplotes crassus]|uniref:Uncharacterized protein n=1 Tax=Euplotes crassus TaxID=5936 RepID=A0AAD1Y344_EUPCR|nr:unnamed protein product [Moneuplotes crassus]